MARMMEEKQAEMERALKEQQLTAEQKLKEQQDKLEADAKVAEEKRQEMEEDALVWQPGGRRQEFTDCPPRFQKRKEGRERVS